MPATNINLLSQKEFDKTPLGKFLLWSLTYGRYIIICTEIVVLLAFIYRFSLDRKITDLNEEIEQKSAIISANQAFEGQFRNLQSRTKQIGSLISNQDLAVKIIRHLEQITPTGIRFTSFSYDIDAISIDATSSTNSSLALFLRNLRDSDMLASINLTTLNKTSQGTGEITFQIQAQVKEAYQKISQTSNQTP